MYKKTVIKVGTNVITKENGELDVTVMKNIVEQIVRLKKSGVQIILVSSGAMGAGRASIKLDKNTGDVTKRQVLAAIGQVNLMETYKRLFGRHGIVSAQVLATKEDFRDRRHFLNMKNCFEGLLKANVIPVVNENDVVSITELMFTDNDELAGLVAGMMDMDAVVFLSTVDGVINEEREVISIFKNKDTQWKNLASCQTSSFGRGGMSTKCKIADKLSSIGITTYVVNGKTKNILTDLFEGKDTGTRFQAQKRNLSAIKKWIAYSDGYEKGIVYLNECAEPVLREGARSLLPIGVTKVEGSFEKGDVIKIINHKKKDIGFGKVEYGSDMAQKYAGKKGKKVLVHYDYLYLS